jgi:hypothetical protein
VITIIIAAFRAENAPATNFLILDPIDPMSAAESATRYAALTRVRGDLAEPGSGAGSGCKQR